MSKEANTKAGLIESLVGSVRDVVPFVVQAHPLNAGPVKPPVDPSEGYSLEQLYEFTKSDIVQIVSLRGPFAGLVMVIDEEGAVGTPPKPVNAVATAMYHLSGGPWNIHGDVLVCKQEHIK